MHKLISHSQCENWLVQEMRNIGLKNSSHFEESELLREPVFAPWHHDKRSISTNRQEALRKGFSLVSTTLILMTVLSVAFFGVPGSIGVARAATGKTYWGLDGYLGNDTIYLTDCPNPAYFNQNKLGNATSPVAYTSSVYGNRYVDYSNFVNLSASENGQYPENTSNPPNAGFIGMSHYRYSASSNLVVITFSIGIDGVSNVTNTSVQQNNNTYYFPYQQLVNLTVSGVNVPNSQSVPVAQISNDKTLGLNTSGSGKNGGTTVTQKYENLILDILGFVPYLGYAISTYQTMKDLMALLSPVSSSINTTIYKAGSVYEYFNVSTNNVTSDQNVWGSSVNITVDLPTSASGTKISLMGENVMQADTSSLNTNAISYLNYTTTKQRGWLFWDSVLRW